MAKRTKKEMYAMIIALVENTPCGEQGEMIEFLNHELELLERKSSKSGATKNQKENLILMDKIVEAFEEMEKPVTITEFQSISHKEVANLSNQKLSALLKKLVDEDNPRMVKTVEKKKAYFSIAR